MRKTSLLLMAAICLQIFCLPLQQSLAQGSNDPVSQDVLDSESYVRSAGQRPRLRNYSTQIEALLRRMTVEEKVGQMTQLAIDQITSGSDSSIAIDAAKLEKAIVQYKVGSILNVSGHALPVDKWHDIIGSIQNSAGKTRLKIPVIYGIDSIHGANYVKGATLFPQQIGMGASWNPRLMQKAAEVAAKETRAAAIPWSFSPVLDVGRQPAWPRFWETFGEDPYLASVLGVAFVRGLEGNNVADDVSVASSLKHYVGYSMPLSGRDRTPAWIPENHLREYFLPPFEAAVKAGARTVMVNSAEINGVPGHTNKHLLTDVLKGELKFDGFIVSDWEDIKKLVTQWRVAADEKEATRMAIMAGIDMSMVPNSYSFSDHLIELVKERKVPMTRIDDAVRRILRVKFELGLFENPMPNPAVKNNFNKPEYVDASLQAARETMTLLKNENNILPLPKNKKVLVTGPTADSLIALNNGWTWTWQGSEPSLYPTNKMTIQAAIKQKIGERNFEFRQGTAITRPPNTPVGGTPVMYDVEVDVAKAVDEAKDSDYVVLCLGEGSYTETPGNITDLTLPETQLRFAEQIIATGKPVILVLVEGRPRVISRIADKVKGILLAYNPSDEGGRAVADVLFGDYNPNGKLPFTYPRSTNNHLTYDHKIFEVEATAFGNVATQPQFEFGSGLSYTTYGYSDLNVSPRAVGPMGNVNVSVKVTNTGSRAGKETVILYLRDEAATLVPAGKRVKRFAKVFLESNQSKTLTFTLSRNDFSFINENNRSVVEPGDFTVMVGGLSEKFTLR